MSENAPSRQFVATPPEDGPETAGWSRLPVQLPPKPLPSTLTELLAECEKRREQILAAMRSGQPALPGSLDSFAALLKGEKHGFLLPPLSRLFDAAIALGLGDAPAFSEDPQTGRDTLAALDGLLAWCRAKRGPSPSSVPRQKFKEPPAEAFLCYRLFVVRGVKQSTLAKELSQLLHRPVDQPTVSRWLQQVRAWLQAGNILPDLEEPTWPRPRTTAKDTSQIDRRAGRKRHRVCRQAKEDEARRVEELDRLIAEQQDDMDED